MKIKIEDPSHRVVTYKKIVGVTSEPVEVLVRIKDSLSYYSSLITRYYLYVDVCVCMCYMVTWSVVVRLVCIYL